MLRRWHKNRGLSRVPHSQTVSFMISKTIMTSFDTSKFVWKKVISVWLNSVLTLADNQNQSPNWTSSLFWSLCITSGNILFMNFSLFLFLLSVRSCLIRPNRFQNILCLFWTSASGNNLLINSQSMHTDIKTCISIVYGISIGWQTRTYVI